MDANRDGNCAGGSTPRRAGRPRTKLRVAAFLLIPALSLGCGEPAKAPASKGDSHSHDHSGGEEGHDHGPGHDDKDGHDHDKKGEGKADEVSLTPQAIKENGIVVAAAESRVLRPKFIVPARVTFNTEQLVHVGAPLPGRVSQLRVRLGDLVKKGDVLLVIESPELGNAQSEYLLKRTAEQMAVPALELSQVAYQRGKALYDESKSIALSEVQRREIDYKSAQAVLQSARTALVTAENTLRLWGMDDKELADLAKSGKVRPYFNVLAPIGGQVVEREITLGERVSPDKEQLMVIANTETIWVIADVPESRFSRIRVGAAVDVLVDDAKIPVHRGKISFVEPIIDPATRTARVRIEVENGDGGLRPGMFARAEVEAEMPGQSEAPSVAIPDEAVQSWEGSTVVFAELPGKPHTFAARPVSIGRPVAGWVPVLSGLSEGERIVVKGSFLIKADLGKGSAQHEH